MLINHHCSVPDTFPNKCRLLVLIYVIHLVFSRFFIYSHETFFSIFGFFFFYHLHFTTGTLSSSVHWLTRLCVTHTWLRSRLHLCPKHWSLSPSLCGRDLMLHPRVMSVGGHGTGEFLNLIFWCFMVLLQSHEVFTAFICQRFVKCVIADTYLTFRRYISIKSCLS